MHGIGCIDGCDGTFWGIFEYVALLLWCHHSEQGQHQHSRTTPAHALAVVIDCPVGVAE